MTIEHETTDCADDAMRHAFAYRIIVYAAHGIHATGILGESDLVLEDCGGVAYTVSERAEWSAERNEDWLEAWVDDEEGRGVYAVDEGGNPWRVEMHEGDLIAVHPRAVWCDGCGFWRLPHAIDVRKHFPLRRMTDAV